MWYFEKSNWKYMKEYISNCKMIGMPFDIVFVPFFIGGHKWMTHECDCLDLCKFKYNIITHAYPLIDSNAKLDQ